MQHTFLISLYWIARHKYCARNDHNVVSHPKVNNWTFDFQFTLSYGVHSGIRCVGGGMNGHISGEDGGSGQQMAHTGGKWHCNADEAV